MLRLVGVIRAERRNKARTLKSSRVDRGATEGRGTLQVDQGYASIAALIMAFGDRETECAPAQLWSVEMARYFFHIMNGKAEIDTVGVELPDLETVRTEAITSAGEMISKGDQTWGGNAWQMVVADNEGTIVFGVSVATDRHGL